MSAAHDLPASTLRAKSTLSNLSRLFAQPLPSKRAGVRRIAPGSSPAMTTGDVRPSESDSRLCNSIPADFLSKRDREALRARIRARSEVVRGHRSGGHRQRGTRGPSATPARHVCEDVTEHDVDHSSEDEDLDEEDLNPSGKMPGLAHSSEAFSHVDADEVHFDSDDEPMECLQLPATVGSLRTIPCCQDDAGKHSADSKEGASAQLLGGTLQDGQQAPDQTVTATSVCALQNDLMAMMREQQKLAHELKSLAMQQRHHYDALNELLQENFRATGALESRVDQLAGRAFEPTAAGRHPMSRLGWTMLDMVSALLILVIGIVATPVGWIMAATRAKIACRASSPPSRRSWRLSAAPDAAADHERRLSAATRLSFAAMGSMLPVREAA
jgi:hypothetical protein